MKAERTEGGTRMKRIKKAHTDPEGKAPDRKKKGKRIMLIALIAVAAAVAAFYLAVILTVRLSNDVMTLEEGEKTDFRPDAILVLGAGVRDDGTPSAMLEDRLLTALRLYEAGVSDKIIVSGDHREGYDEVNAMKDYLTARSVPSAAVYMDHAGFCTYDSLYRAGAVFGAKSLLLVTQEYHAYRALYDGKRLGLDCRAVAAPILSTDASRYAKGTLYQARESFACCKDFIWCLFRFEPAVLGDSVSLEASGDLTNDRPAGNG